MRYYILAELTEVHNTVQTSRASCFTFIRQSESLCDSAFSAIYRQVQDIVKLHIAISRDCSNRRLRKTSCNLEVCEALF